MVLEIHILPRPTASPAQAARRASALTALRQLCAAVSHATLTVDAACGANMLHAPAAAAVTPTTVARCMLDLGPWLSVPVWLFKAVTEAKAPSFKLHSDLDADPNAAEAPTHTIIRTTVLKLVSDLGGDMVPPQDVMAAFRYGRDLVPVITAERERMKVLRCSPMCSLLWPQAASAFPALTRIPPSAAVRAAHRRHRHQRSRDLREGPAAGGIH